MYSIMLAAAAAATTPLLRYGRRGSATSDLRRRRPRCRS
jgi:hypothetical protein